MTCPLPARDGTAVTLIPTGRFLYCPDCNALRPPTTFGPERPRVLRGGVPVWIRS